MTDGTSQGLFIVVAIVIFGIFTVLAYILFEDTLSPAMASMFNTAFENVEIETNYSKNYGINGDFNDYITVDLDWDESLNGTLGNNFKENGGWSWGFNTGVENRNQGYHAHLDIEKFGQPVMAFPHVNGKESSGKNRWLGIYHHWEPDSELMRNIKEDSELIINFDLWSDSEEGYMFGGIFQQQPGIGYALIEGTELVEAHSTKKETWENVTISIPLSDKLNKNKSIGIYLYGYGDDVGVTKYIDNVEVRISR